MRKEFISNPKRREAGVIYTKPWMVDLILDLAGYTRDKRLAELVAVEPSAGDGAFLVPRCFEWLFMPEAWQACSRWLSEGLASDTTGSKYSTNRTPAGVPALHVHAIDSHQPALSPCFRHAKS